MDKLRLKFWRNKKVVMMKVIQQDESLRGAGVIFYKEEEEDCMAIESAINPSLSSNTIYIRGEFETWDNEVACISLKTEKDAKDYLMRCIKTINSYNLTVNAKTEEEEEESNMTVVTVE